MTCVQCNSLFSTTDNFCRNCGSPIKYASPQTSSHEDDKQAVTLLLIYMCWGFFVSLLYLFINKVAMRGTETFNRAKIYEVLSWGTQLSSLLMLIIFSIIVRSNRVRTFLIIFAAAELLVIAGYRIIR
jgi:hypothetical protein